MELATSLLVDRPEPELLDASLNLIANELNQQRLHPPGGDPVIKAMSQAILHKIQRRTPITQVLAEVGISRGIIKEGGSSPSEIVGGLRSSLAMYLLDHYEEYPHDGFDNAPRWSEPLDEFTTLLSADIIDPYAQRMKNNLLHRKVQTNIARRYLPVDLITQIMADRFKGGVRWLDIGSGVMEGPNQLMLKHEYPFEPLNVGAPNGNGSDALSIKADELLERPTLVCEAIATDIENVYNNEEETYNPGILEWARGSLRPQEVMNRQFMKRFNGLIAQKAPNVHFQRVDLSDVRDEQKFRESYGDQPFDVVSYITVLHQLSPERRARIRQVGRSLLGHGGIEIEQDFIFGRGRHPRELHYFNHWHDPYTYRTFVRDTLDPKGVNEEVFKNRDSRITRLAPGIGQLLINGERVTVSEAILGA